MLVLPGDVIPADKIPTQQGTPKTLTLGPGLQYYPPNEIRAGCAGNLAADPRKNALWLENNGTGRYVPAAGDLVIATVHHSSVDFYHLAITSYTPHATLPQLAFEGASRKTRPILAPGSLVYARISLANKHMDPEVECVHPSTGKSEGLGELKGGMVFDISLGLARRLMMNKAREDGHVAVLEESAERGLRFEIAVGRNGRIWINSDNVKTTLIVGNAIQETDAQRLGVEQQLKLVRKLVKAQ